jgi:hypothetical protein
MTPPYLFSSDSNGEPSSYQGRCSAPSNCSNVPGTRWVEENPDSGGNPRTISFVDDTATQYSTYSFSAKHPFAGFGPNITGTATITHADGRSYTVPLNLSPNSQEVALGRSEGRPRPPQKPKPGQPCTIPPPTSTQRPFTRAQFYRLLKLSVKDFRDQGTHTLLKYGGVLRNVVTCAQGRLKVTVTARQRGKRIVVAKGKKSFSYRGPGRTGLKVRPTRAGRRLLKAAHKARLNVSVRVFDAQGHSAGYTRRVTMRR